MRLTVASALMALLALSACGSSNSGGPNNDPQFDGNCAEQSGLANLGRTDGREIRITCP